MEVREGKRREPFLEKHERVSGRKNCPRESAVLVSLYVWPNVKWERRLGDEGLAHKMTEQNESG